MSSHFICYLQSHSKQTQCNNSNYVNYFGRHTIWLCLSKINTNANNDTLSSFIPVVESKRFGETVPKKKISISLFKIYIDCQWFLFGFFSDFVAFSCQVMEFHLVLTVVTLIFVDQFLVN